MEYTAIIKKQPDDSYFAQCEQMPNAITQGDTIEEAIEFLKEAIQLLLECEQEDFRKENIGHECIKIGLKLSEAI